jgi:hypothetical protein
MRAQSLRVRTISFIAVCLSCVTSLPANAQTAPPPHLQILILDGEGALNDIRQGVAREPIVQVEDENHKPVAGAVVVFTLPESGPSGSFLGGSKILTVVTDAQGKATATGLKPNTVSGQFQVRVTASYQKQTAQKAISQTNSLGAKPVPVHAFPMKAVVIGAAVAGAVVVGVVVATHSGGTNAATITAGTPTFGAPSAPDSHVQLSAH